ncbi:MAG: OadG family protein [Kiritimatiellae bacterium]|nr:OadG family protein [Kiritimatiellia bacterium]
MAVLGQGLVLMLAGMGIVYVFLSILIVVTLFSMKGIAKFDGILPQEAPKKAPRKTEAPEDENVALAIAVALA